MNRFIGALFTVHVVACSSHVTLVDDVAANAECHLGFELVDGVCRVEEVYFEGGRFLMGRGYCFPRDEHEAEFADGLCDASDEPHWVEVGPFYMDAVEAVDLDGFPADCTSRTLDCSSPSDYKQHYASSDEAAERCRRRGKQLPTEAQWEYAASAGGTRTYPWGESEPTCSLAAFEDCGLGPSFLQVARFPPSPEGLYDLAGNAAEYVIHDAGEHTEGYPPVTFRSCELDYPHWDIELCPCPLGEPCPASHVRGGAHEYRREYLRAADRRHAGSTSPSNPGGVGRVGYRCIRLP